MEACHVGGFEDFGECDKFGKILSTCQMHAKGTNKVANLTNLANMTIFRQGQKFKRMSSRQGYQQSGEFDKYGEFGEYGEFDNILPKTKIQANELKTREPTKLGM